MSVWVAASIRYKRAEGGGEVRVIVHLPGEPRITFMTFMAVNLSVPRVPIAGDAILLVVGFAWDLY
jgi:hypothetical protein